MGIARPVRSLRGSKKQTRLGKEMNGEKGRTHGVGKSLQAHLLDLSGERIDVLGAVGRDIGCVGEEGSVVEGVGFELG